MKLTLAIQGRKERVQVDSEPFSIRLKEGLFCVTTPMHDDWLQTVDFDMRKVDAVIQVDGPDWVIYFPAGDAQKQFQAWLTEANAKAKQGYKTIWP